MEVCIKALTSESGYYGTLNQGQGIEEFVKA